MKYQLIKQCDEELYQFYLRQKTYFSLIPQEITYQSIQEDMLGPAGFDEKQHYHYKIYEHNQMVAYLDYILGYRFSMQHDSHYLWIGLFLVEESLWQQHYGKRIISKLCQQYQDYTIQLACLVQNKNGITFWQAMGFQEIARSYSGHEEVVIFEKQTKEIL
ncbi:GNAT family N-acetyltransferase [Allocoprobacillus halotolerans]|uniref:GNAT family N-acetyltransferase n=1 Tax=Allocoprobacillus halotolerans TaxID=2944914 RepID=A0ABY5I0E2_9FIRM|nr:GNAT family N-acetyltransferase [Allocoprobacillus halotolerans]UTY38813.1 GNAT family N-acetyltransferase [Allocoprobacillus halotolerans]